MKKTVAIIISLMLTFGMVSCGNDNSSSSVSTQNSENITTSIVDDNFNPMSENSFDDEISVNSFVDSNSKTENNYTDEFETETNYSNISASTEVDDATGNFNVKLSMDFKDKYDVYNNVIDFLAILDTFHEKVNDYNVSCCIDSILSAEQTQFAHIVISNDNQVDELFECDNKDFKLLLAVGLNEISSCSDIKIDSEPNDVMPFIMGSLNFGGKSGIIYADVTGSDDKTSTASGVLGTDGAFILTMLDEDFIKEHGYKSCEIVAVIES